MKRRVITGCKILAVALTAAGCSSATANEIPATPAAVNGPAAPEAPAASVTSPPAEPAAPAAAPAATPARPMSTDPALLALRDQLHAERRGKVKDPARFRPLCDKDGYPLVGNVVRKAPDPGAQPSGFCLGLREQAKQ